jgi:phage replication-related protein YjqB (UPF0714/DUF867 family)
VHLRGTEEATITNRGQRQAGVQLEFSREARNLLFPPDASRRARQHPSIQLARLARAVHQAIRQLCDEHTGG